ncbi:MAG: hypothetical protein ACE5G1_04245 [bacterium]
MNLVLENGKFRPQGKNLSGFGKPEPVQAQDYHFKADKKEK